MGRAIVNLTGQRTDKVTSATAALRLRDSGDGECELRGAYAAMEAVDV